MGRVCWTPGGPSIVTGPSRAVRFLALAALAASCQTQPTTSSAASAPQAAAPHASSLAAPPRPVPNPPSSRASDTARGSVEVTHVVEFCTAGASASERLPLLVALHGIGDRPESFAALFRDLPVPARVMVPEALERYHDGFSWFPIDLWKPDPAHVADGVRLAGDVLGRSIERWLRERPTRGKPVVVGYSQGGMLTFELAVHHPELVQIAIAAAGWLPPPLWPTVRPVAPSPPIIALHGEDDELLPIQPTRDSVAALVRLGYPVELVPFAHTAHRMSPEMKAELERRVEQALR
jgi:phospholipase/carboxylesterase